jgi:ATP-binding cassette subfamily B protein
MTATQPSADRALPAALQEQLRRNPPFSLLPEQAWQDLLPALQLRRYPSGRRLCRPDELPGEVLLLLSGEVRLLVQDLGSDELFTLKRGQPGRLIGWSSLLRGSPCEAVYASSDSVALAVPAERFVACVQQHPPFREHFLERLDAHEAWSTVQAWLGLQAVRPPLSTQRLRDGLNGFQVRSLSAAGSELPEGYLWLLSSGLAQECPIGSALAPDQLSQLRPIPQATLPLRLVGMPLALLKPDDEIEAQPAFEPSLWEAVAEAEPQASGWVDLQSLGILEAERLRSKDRFPSVTGRGMVGEAMAVVEMVASHLQVPYRRDVIQRVLDDQFRRDKAMSLQLLAGLCELLGLQTQLASVNPAFLGSVEVPVLLMVEGVPQVLYEVRGRKAVLGNPQRGLVERPLTELQQQLGDSLSFVTVKKVASTPESRFGWGWFVPLISRYRWPLVLVFVASLLAQLFGLAIPLLLQQIIDKTLAQGNLSSLNVLGAAMVVMAVFQAVLIGLRQYLFVDTTDRMDLTLGSAVIDRLLALPLRYFDSRPVGELSQRLGELNTIRGFLTGTALSSGLNLLFASLYLVVMLIYSPLLTAVALSSLPVYLIIVFVISPIYRNLLRRRAESSARTQSHLIEVLAGIQTVKAQHIELTSRWKWQDRYKDSVAQGFRSVVLGTAAGQTGSFLNTLSGLLVLWVGMAMVLNGQFTLGQLLAFRIISGNVTGPLLQLSTLWQSFQGVMLSMERLSDILDQPAEQASEALQQIALPPISGAVSFERVSFRFATGRGPWQVEEVSLEVPAGSFVGVVGQSGSGKSTLMKLLPRLYSPESGRVMIDGYDVAKVELSSLRQQVGIVPQESLLFEGTVAENIALNDPNASSQSIEEAARIACAHDFIMDLPMGYATRLSERGSNLSGGQRQRMAIARTVLSNPSLLVMDEATSALDYDTERQLCLQLQEWAKGRTVFFITHRLSTIRNADLILVMHQGRLVESGAHADLMAKQGRYYALYRQQSAAGE